MLLRLASATVVRAAHGARESTHFREGPVGVGGGRGPLSESLSKPCLWRSLAGVREKRHEASRGAIQAKFSVGLFPRDGLNASAGMALGMAWDLSMNVRFCVLGRALPFCRKFLARHVASRAKAAFQPTSWLDNDCDQVLRSQSRRMCELLACPESESVIRRPFPLLTFLFSESKRSRGD